MLDGCYNIRKKGAEFNPTDTLKCQETWFKDKSGKDNYYLNTISCPQINFKPNGWFHKSNNHTNLSDKTKDGKKVPLSVSVGKCNTL